MLFEEASVSNVRFAMNQQCETAKPKLCERGDQTCSGYNDSIHPSTLQSQVLNIRLYCIDDKYPRFYWVE